MVKAGKWGMRACAALIVAACGLIPASAQNNKRTVTPVESDEEAPPKPVLHYYDKHGERLEQPVLYLAELDTAKAVRPGSPYPLYNGIVLGVNFGDAILKLTGQKHSSYDVSAAVSLHNWFFPIVEAGVGWGAYTESGDAFHYKAKPSFYAKAGINYNFLYKSSPDYMAYIGLRFGISSHTWDITDIKPDSQLGKDTGKTELIGQSCTSLYGEALAGLKVKIAGPFSLGWSIRYRIGLHNSGESAPWFVPGYGTGPLGFNINAYFTFGEKPRRDAKTINGDDIPATATPSGKPDSSQEDNSSEETYSTQNAESSAGTNSLLKKE